MPVNALPTASFLYRFLIHPEYRAARYVMLIVAIAVISLNIALFSFRENISLVGNRLYGVAFLIFLVNLTVGILNLCVLVPQYLIKKKYVTYICLLSLGVFFMIGMQILCEYLTYTHWDLPGGRSSYCNGVTLLDIISGFVMNIICLVGISMPVVFKCWTTENQYMGEIEKKHLQTELNRLKEQVDPYLLLNVLHQTGTLTVTDSAKASALLMKLSQILRYELYDCNRNYVSLNSEIRYLDNYLQLAQLRTDRLQYQIGVSGTVLMTLVSPLVFIPFVRYVVEEAHAEKMNIAFQVTEGEIDFTCRYESSENISDSGFQQIRQRLSLLYKDNFCLSAAQAGLIRLHLKKTDYGK